MAAIVDSKERADFTPFSQERASDKSRIALADYVDVAPTGVDFTKKVLSPDIDAISREQVIKIQLAVLKTPEEKFPLVAELFKMKVAAFKALGGSIEEFAQERRVFGETHEAVLNGFKPTEGEHKALKAEMATLHAYLFDLAYEQYKNKTINWPFTKIFELEKQTGFEVGADKLLQQDFESASLVFVGEESINRKDLESLYWTSLVPQLLKFLTYFDKEQKPDICKFLQSWYRRVSVVCGYRLKTSDIVNQNHFMDLWPYFAKYQSLKDVAIIFGNLLDNWPKSSKYLYWVFYLCKAAKIVAAQDPAKAKECLEEARIAAEYDLSPPWFSKERERISIDQSRALREIQEAKEEIAKKSSSQTS